MKPKNKTSDIISLKSIPQELAFFEKSFSKLFNNIYFEEYFINNSSDNKTVEHSIHIVTEDVIALSIPGTDLRFLINYEGDNSGFWFNISIYKGILAYFSNFNTSSLSGSLEDFYNIFSKILDVDRAYLLLKCVEEYEIGTNKIEDGFSNINTFCSLNIVFDSDLSEYENYQLLSEEIFNHSSETLWSILFNLYIDINTLTEAEKKDRVAFIVGKCFNNEYEFTFDDIIKYLYSQIIPNLIISTDVILGIEIPRKILLPIKQNGEVETDESKKIILKLAESIVNFSTDKGLDIQNEVSVSFPTEYPTAKILNTEFGFGFSEAKLLKEESSNGKMGLFVKNAMITFPANWNHDNTNSTAQIVGRNLLIGTGGISGTIGMEAKQGVTTTPLLKLKLGQDFNISLDAFSITFQQSSIISSLIKGTLTIPGVKKKEIIIVNGEEQEGDYSSDPVSIDIEAFIGNNGEFKINAQPVGGLSFFIENVARIDITSLSLGKENDKYYISVAGALDFSELAGKINGVESDFPTNIPLKKLKIWEDGKMEFDAGIIALPRAISLEIGPAKLAVTSLLFSSTELYHNGKKRQYGVIGFDGSLDIKPGGVSVKGEGVKICYTTDNKTDVSESSPDYRPLHIFTALARIL